MMIACGFHGSSSVLCTHLACSTVGVLQRRLLWDHNSGLAQRRSCLPPLVSVTTLREIRKKKKKDWYGGA